MVLIRREDGVQFVGQSYRELLIQKNSTLLKKEICLIGKTNGEFARLFKQRDSLYEAIFSHEPGYLLGETVWRYFGKPADLIYCETLPDKEHAIVVIVRSGSIYLDAKLPLANLQDEFISLTAGNNRFVIYIYGDIPLAERAEEGKFSFDPLLVHSFNQLETPLFPRLPIDDELKLVPMEEAIRSLRLGERPFSVIILALLMIISSLLYWLYAGKEKLIPQQAVTFVQPHAKLQQLLAKQLRGPSIAQQLQQLVVVLSSLYNLPGWTVRSLDFDAYSITAQLYSLGGGAMELLNWSKQNIAEPNLTSEGAKLIFPLNLPKRTLVPALLKQEEVTAGVIDKMLQTLPVKSVHINEVKRLGGLLQESLTITFTNISPNTLALIGKQLDDLPVKLVKGSIAQTDGLLAGQLELLAIGD